MRKTGVLACLSAILVVGCYPRAHNAKAKIIPSTDEFTGGKTTVLDWLLVRAEADGLPTISMRLEGVFRDGAVLMSFKSEATDWFFIGNHDVTIRLDGKFFDPGKAKHQSGRVHVAHGIAICTEYIHVSVTRNDVEKIATATDAAVRVGAVSFPLLTNHTRALAEFLAAAPEAHPEKTTHAEN